MAYDPVCGMDVDRETAPAQVKYEGETYFFCSDECYQEFMDSPEDFVPEGLASEMR